MTDILWYVMLEKWKTGLQYKSMQYVNSVSCQDDAMEGEKAPQTRNSISCVSLHQMVALVYSVEIDSQNFEVGYFLQYNYLLSYSSAMHKDLAHSMHYNYPQKVNYLMLYCAILCNFTQWKHQTVERGGSKFKPLAAKNAHSTLMLKNIIEEDI